jgi:hypothetical protein
MRRVLALRPAPISARKRRSGNGEEQEREQALGRKQAFLWGGG